MGLGSGIRDSGSEKNLFWIPDPGVKKGTGSGSATLVLIHSKSENENLKTKIQCKRIRDVYPRFELFQPRCRIQGQKGIGLKLSSRKYDPGTGCLFRIQDLDFFHPGSGSATLQKA
jgi:hypothetical protein